MDIPHIALIIVVALSRSIFAAEKPASELPSASGLLESALSRAAAMKPVETAEPRGAEAPPVAITKLPGKYERHYYALACYMDLLLKGEPLRIGHFTRHEFHVFMKPVPYGVMVERTQLLYASRGIKLEFDIAPDGTIASPGNSLRDLEVQKILREELELWGNYPIPFRGKSPYETGGKSPYETGAKNPYGSWH